MDRTMMWTLLIFAAGAAGATWRWWSLRRERKHQERVLAEADRRRAEREGRGGTGAPPQ